MDQADPVDLVYILGKGSRNQNRELIFSLRSAAKFAHGLRKVFVVGEDPGFLSPLVRHVGVSETGPNKEYNIASKVLVACSISEISDPFLCIHDDHIFNEPVHLPTYPFYHCGTLDRFIDLEPAKDYHYSLRDTARWLKAANAPMYHFDVHTPFPVHKKIFSRLACAWLASRESSHGFIVKSIYGNLGRIALGPRIRDCKIKQLRGVGDVEGIIRGRDVFSFSDDGFRDGVDLFLQQRLPKKCPFES